MEQAVDGSADRQRDRRGGRGEAAPGEAGLRVLGVLLGVFFIAMGAGKLGWLIDPDLLAQRFQRWAGEASPPVRWYLLTLALPGAPLFARLVPLAELALGAALVTGVARRAAAILGFVMVLNFHFATGAVSDWAFLRDGTGLPVLGGLLAVALSGRARRSKAVAAPDLTGT